MHKMTDETIEHKVATKFNYGPSILVGFFVGGFAGFIGVEIIKATGITFMGDILWAGCFGGMSLAVIYNHMGRMQMTDYENKLFNLEEKFSLLSKQKAPKKKSK